MSGAEEILVEWHRARKGADCWNWSRALYMYMLPDNTRPLYLGLAYQRTVRERWNGPDKRPLWEALRSESGLGRSRVRVYAGKIWLPEGQRISSELVEDIESLLIKRIKPWWNIRSTQSRISRPGMRILCGGSWPLPKWRFWDVG
jgi:hypothetical protein